MGLRMTDLGFFGTGAKGEARAEVERKLREALDKGVPCSLMNLENQVIPNSAEVTGTGGTRPYGASAAVGRQTTSPP